jgi:hypothetical protein
MNNIVLTGFDENYWQQWGLSWIISLKEFAKFNGSIIVVGFNLSTTTVSKLAEFGVTLLTGEGKDIRVGTLNAIQKIQFENPCVVAFWDADVYFQEEIDEIFDLAKNQIVITNNAGFIAFPNEKYSDIKEMQDMVTFVEGVFVFDYLKHYGVNISIIDDTWNYVDLPNLQEVDGKLGTDKVQKVIHPSGHIKTLLTGKNLTFWDRYKDIYNKYIDVKSHGKRLFVSPQK